MASLSNAIQSIAAQSERSPMRDMYRIASLLVALAYAQFRAMSWDVLESVQDNPPAPQLFVAHRCKMPLAEEPLADCATEEQKRTFFSLMRCVSAVVWNTAWLAHLVEGNIQAISS